MQISTSILTMGALQLVLLAMTIYMMVSQRPQYTGRFPPLDAALLGLQVVNLILMTQWVVEYAGNRALLFVGEGIFLLIILLRWIQLFRKARARRKELLLPQSVREAIDHLPGGICFSTPSGRPILTNRRMNELVYRLTGHTVMHAESVWEELRGISAANGCAKLNESWMHQGPIGEDLDESLFFSFPDKRIWRFRKETLTDQFPLYVQMEAVDLTDLYQYSKELYENNQKLKAQHARQQNLLENIVEINHEKEILQAKMRIHGDLGRSILATKQFLSNETLGENLPFLTELWSKTIRNLTDFTHIDADAETSPEIELQSAAEMIGCSIRFYGDRPTGRKAVLLFYASVREALTNAVMHAQANRLDVATNRTSNGYHVRISDNGSVVVSGIVEGSGLGNLRRRLEQEGATLRVRCAEGVVLHIDLPTGESISAQEVARG